MRIKRGIMPEVMFAVMVGRLESDRRIGVAAVISVACLFDVEEVFSLVGGEVS